MDAVAIGADRNLGVAFSETQAMDACAVLGQLVGPQAGVELSHECRIGMTSSAELRYLPAIDVSFPSRTAAHGFFGIITRRIAAVATGACQAMLRVNILSILFLGNSQGFWKRGMTIEAGVLYLSEAQDRAKDEDAKMHETR